MDDDRLRWCLRYIRMGLAVFPLRGKRPLTLHGSHDATLDENQVRAWLAKWPEANVGVATGHGCFVMDVDVKLGGEESFDSLCHEHGPFPDTLQQITGTGGKHLVFTMPDFPVRNSTSMIAPGIDIRGRGGYIVVAPSIHPVTKRAYVWDGLKEIEQQTIAPAPAWLLDRLRPGANAKQAVAKAVPTKISEGTRNAQLYKLACSQRRKGLSEFEILATIRASNQTRCSPPLLEAELVTIAKSSARYAPDQRADVFGGGPVKAVPAPAPGGVGDGAAAILPRIYVGGRDLREEANDCLAVLRAANVPPHHFVQAGQMFEIVMGEKGREIGRPVTDAALRGWLTRVADFRKKTARGDLVACFPPKDVVQDLLAIAPGGLGFPALDGIVSTPVIRRDGSILAKPGYDLESKLYYSPAPGFRLPAIDDCPGSYQIDSAKRLLDEMCAGFPFADESSKANVIAAILTPIVRPVIDGPTPMASITAPAAGTGKSLIAEMVARICTGEPAEMSSLPRDEEEMRKALTTHISSMAQVVVFDNITRRVDSGDLAKALTATTHADRAFRTHQKMVMPVRCTWIATGNNLRLGGDLPRRCFWIRLDALTARPELRSDFKIPDLKAWVLVNRPRLLAALLVLARAWYSSGRPKASQRPVGGFESWSIAVGGILEHAGISGFLGNAAVMRDESDIEAGQWERFLLVLKDIIEQPFAISDVYKRLTERVANTFGGGGGGELSPEADQLRQTLPDYLAEVADRSGFFQRRAGKLFAEHCGRRFGDSEIYLCKDGISHHAQTWAIKSGS